MDQDQYVFFPLLVLRLANSLLVIVDATLLSANMKRCLIDSFFTIVTINIRDRLKAANMKFDRYKFVVQCVIGENKGQGVKYGCRCLWDSDTDGMAEYVYLNESLFCAVAAFGIFFY